MANFKFQHKGQGSTYPIDCIDAAGGPPRVEPIINGQIMQQRFLFGIPLTSPFDPTSKLGPKDLDDYIVRGISKLEADTRITVSPVVRRTRLPFDPTLYYNNIWLECPHKPISRILRLAIQSASYIDTFEYDTYYGGFYPNYPAWNATTPYVIGAIVQYQSVYYKAIQDSVNQAPLGSSYWEPTVVASDNATARYPHGADIYIMPSQWLDVSYASHGKIFINPINPAFAAVGFTEQAASSGATILQFIGIQGWVPAYWTLTCEVGLASIEGNVPIFLNEAIGQASAILVLDNLIPLFRYASQSLSIDGMGQSTNDQMQVLLKQKRDDMEKEYLISVKRLKSMYGGNFITSNV